MINIDFEPNNTRQTAETITFLERQLLNDGLVITNDDWYIIEVDEGSDSLLTALLSFDHSQGDLDFQLLDFNGNILQTRETSTDDEFIWQSGLSDDLYYLRVYGYSLPIPGNGVEYTLQWDDFSTSNKSFDFENNETRGTAEDITLREKELLTGGIVASNDDWFEIEVDSGSNSTITALLTFNHDDGDLDFQLVDSFGTVIDEEISSTDNEFVSASDLSDGTYYLRVYSAEGTLLGSEYSLQWDDFSRANRDIDFENNETRETAEDISFRQGELLTGGIVASNDDWFEIEVDSGSNSSISASIFFEHDNGDLDLKLLDSTGTEIGSGTSTNDNELIEASDLSDGTYYLRVYSPQGTIVGNEYSLQWSDSGVVTEPPNPNPEPNPNPDPVTGSGFDTQYYRFQNTEVPGTYLFVDETERQNILANFPVFREEGFAFKVRREPGGDDLVEVNRYRSNKTQGTYLFATADNFQTDASIIQSDFTNEGRAFYAYGAGSGDGVDYYRFENTEKAGTYLFPEGVERDNILVNFPSFEDQGAVWAVER